MTNKKLLNLLDGYEKKLIEVRDSHPCGEKWFGYQQIPGTHKMEHALQMIPKMRKFLEEGRREKAFRWLGFLQCVFWMTSIYEVEDLANHSRPSKKELKEQHPQHSFNSGYCPKECGWGFDYNVPCKFNEEYASAPDEAFPIK